jgi:peptidoglycan/LPS O-acetylase OafA/YrhL
MKNFPALSNKGTIPALDGLRGVSILAVIGFHGAWPGFSGGGRGVDLFYVISGFLIAWLLLKEKEKFGTVSLKKFYYRRMLRIPPAFYVFLAGYGLLCHLVFTDFRKDLSSSLLIAGTYSTNFMMGWFNREVLVAHTWSLSLEEQFYLFFPALVAFLSRRKVTVLALVLVVVTPLYRLALYQLSGTGNSPLRLAYSPDTRFDTIIWGCLIALLLFDERAGLWLAGIFRRNLTLIAGLVVMSVNFYLSERSVAFLSTIGYSLNALSFVCILLFTLFREDHPLNQLMSLKPMQLTGRLSYALYLWHPVALGLAGRCMKHVPSPFQDATQVALYLCMSFLLAAASYLIVEQPFLKLKDKFAVVRAA